ncbi:MAG: Histidine kinase, gyrase and HSP90-like ATPase [Candidatus Parcubacteria bacterium]|jgi:hypothetical protein
MKKAAYVDVGFHAGRQLILNGGIYDRFESAAAEMVQNALDAEARRIDVILDLKKRQFTIADDGSGVSSKQFAEKLARVSSSTKTDGKYGKHGIGFFSLLPKSKRSRLVSVSKFNPGEGYTEYSFDSATIESSPEVRIPQKDCPHIVHGKDGVWWRSLIEAQELNKDRTSNDFSLTRFVDDIALRYSAKIRSNGVAITVTFTNKEGMTESKEVVVSEFTGNPLPVYRNDSLADAGKVVATLYLARRQGNGRKGQVVFAQSNDLYNLSIDQFIRCTAGMIRIEVIEALRSGAFEGRIVADKVELHKDRERFNRTDALTAMCLALEDWFDSVGRGLLGQAREEDRDTRFQDLGSRAMAFAQELIREKQFAELVDAFQFGTTGKHHKKKRGAELEDRKAISVAGLGGTPDPDPRERSGGVPPKKEHPGQEPGVVYGPRGRRRSQVSGHSTGLRFEVSEFPNTFVPFEFDIPTGTLSINMRHPDFGSCEAGGDDALVSYHVLVAQAAFDLYRHAGKPEFLVLERFTFQHLSTQVFGMLNAKPIIKQAKKNQEKE